MANDYPRMVYPARGLPYQVSAAVFDPVKPRLRFRPRTGGCFAQRLSRMARGRR